jgi:hypothetical protein
MAINIAKTLTIPSEYVYDGSGSVRKKATDLRLQMLETGKVEVLRVNGDQ